VYSRSTRCRVSPEGSHGYSTERVHTFLGVVGLLIFVACTIALAAVVTAAVVRVSPTRDDSSKQTS
jgi:hypothetical protein